MLSAPGRCPPPNASMWRVSTRTFALFAAAFLKSAGGKARMTMLPAAVAGGARVELLKTRVVARLGWQIFECQLSKRRLCRLSRQLVRCAGIRIRWWSRACPRWPRRKASHARESSTPSLPRPVRGKMRKECCFESLLVAAAATCALVSCTADDSQEALVQ